jgi:hypothetical protein
MGARNERRRSRVARGAVVVVLGLLGSAALIWSSTQAAFSGTTGNSGNSWEAGSVSLSDDDSNFALFSVTGLKPGSTGSKCIEVTYTGDIASSVKLYTTALSGTGTLGPYLDFTVQLGTGGTNDDCTGFSSEATLHSTTLWDFASDYTNFGNGIGSWTPSSSGQKKVYKFIYTLQDDDAAEGASAGIGFTWESQST